MRDTSFLKRVPVQLAILALAVCAVFGNTLRNGFVWDDTVLLLGREVYRHFDLGKIFLSAANDVEYLPLRDLSYAVDYAIWGENAAGFHVTGLLLYLANVVVVYFLCRRLFPLLNEKRGEEAATVAPLACTLLFAVHPLHSEAVSFITCRNVLLSGGFFFGTLCLYLRSMETSRLQTGAYAGSLGCFVAALLSKATVITLPLLLLLPPFLGPRDERKRRFFLSLPFFALAGAFFFLFREIGARSGIIGNAPQQFTSSSFLDKLATAVQIPWFYLGKFLLPVGLSANYDVRFATGWTEPVVLGAAAACIILCAAALLFGRRSPLFMFSLGWYLVTLLPVLNFFATIPVVADRYAYLPLFALCVPVAAACALPERDTVRRGVSAIAIVGVICWGAMAGVRNGVWRTDRTLWEETVRVSPGQMKNRVNLATAYYRDKEYDRALALLAATKERNFYYDYYHLFQGHIARDGGDLAAAATAFRAAVDKDDDFIDALYLLGETYEKLKEYDKAVEFYNRTLLSTELDTNGYRASARTGLQRLMAAMNPDLPEMRERVRQQPADLIARMLLAEKLTEFAQYDEALLHFLEMERLGMRSWKLYTSIAGAYMKQKMYPEAAAYYEKSLAMNPADGNSLNSLGIVYKKLGRVPDAIPLFEQAMAVDPGQSFAAFNLALTHYQLGHRELAIKGFTSAGERFPDLREKVAPYLDELTAVKGGKR